MIELREFDLDDVLPIDTVYRKQPWNTIPSLDNVVVNKTFTKDGNIVGYGCVKQFYVASMIIDPDIPNKDKAILVRKALNEAINTARRNGIDQLYLTTPFENFADVLRNQYGFINCDSPFLVLEVK